MAAVWTDCGRCLWCLCVPKVVEVCCSNGGVPGLDPQGEEAALPR